MTRTQCLDGPAKGTGPICCGRFLLCRLSAASGERGRGAKAVRRRRLLPGEAVGMAGRARPASWLLRHTVGQHLHRRKLSVSHQVSDASSLSHGVHTFSTGHECQHVMKGLIHGGRQRRRSWSSSRYDPD